MSFWQEIDAVQRIAKRADRNLTVVDARIGPQGDDGGMSGRVNHVDSLVSQLDTASDERNPSGDTMHLDARRRGVRDALRLEDLILRVMQPAAPPRADERS